jgi:hypothetical protein
MKNTGGELLSMKWRIRSCKRGMTGSQVMAMVMMVVVMMMAMMMMMVVVMMMAVMMMVVVVVMAMTSPCCSVGRYGFAVQGTHLPR